MTSAYVAEDSTALLRRHALWLVVILAIAASLTGIANGFALDDVHIIVQNDRIHSLRNILDVFTQSYWPPDQGGALYRPLTSLAFVIEWAIGNGSPLPFHAVNIALYCAVSVVVFQLARELLRWEAALFAAGLFAVHPVHVEAVANVVGQAELWAALFAVAAITSFIRARKRGALRRNDIIAITGMYAASLMFKEHVVVLPAVLAAAELILFDKDHRRNLLAVSPAMIVVAAVFIVMRGAVIGDLKGAGVSPIFVNTGYSARVYTMLLVIMEWLRLFVWPAHLASDYAPLVSVATSFGVTMLPSLLVLGGLSGMAVLVRKSNPALTFSLAFAAIALLIPSNLVVMTGFVLAERALFLPSVAVMIAIAAACQAIIESTWQTRNPRLATHGLMTAALVLTLGIARSSARNDAWKDNAALIEQNVADLPMSWQAHMMMAQLHSERGRGREALVETEVAVRLGAREDYHLLAFAADMYQMQGDCRKASVYYEKSLAIVPDQPQVKTNAAICASRLKSVQ